VKQARAAIRVLLAKMNTESAVRTKALHARYDQVLAQAQAQLTQRVRLDDALLVKAKREEVAAAWITVAVAIAADATVAQDPKTTAASPKGPAAKTVTPPAKGGDPTATLLGTWMFTWPENGWVGKRTFKADGAFIISDPGKQKSSVVGRSPRTRSSPLTRAGPRNR